MNMGYLRFSFCARLRISRHLAYLLLSHGILNDFMPIKRVTRTTVDRIPAFNRDTIYWDQNLSGLGLCVKTTGVKSLVVQCQNRQTGRSKRESLGRFWSTLSLNEARSLAKVLLADVVRGKDPVTDAQALRTSPTVMQPAEQYLTEHAIARQRVGSVRNDASMLGGSILPRIGNLRVVEVTRSDVVKLHNGMRDTLSGEQSTRSSVQDV